MINLDPISNWIRTARWVITAIVLAGLLGALGFKQHQLDVARAQVSDKNAEIRQMVADAASQREQDQMQARSTEHTLHEALDRNARTFNEQQAAADARIAALSRELRSRPARPAANSGSVATAAGTADAHTGAGLYREDGHFLAGEAAVSARIAGERDLCYRQYDDARRQLSEGQRK